MKTLYLRIFASVCLVFCVFVIAGCSISTGTKPPADSSTHKLVTTLHGEEVMIPINPQRIVALTAVGDLVALGIFPVAAMNFYNGGEFEELFEDVAVLHNTQPFDLEEILSYDPDLIIVYQGLSPERRDDLETIAPVVPVKNDEQDPTIRIAFLGELFDKQTEANAVILSYIDTLNQATTTFQQLGITQKTINVFAYGAGVMVFGSDSFYYNRIIYSIFNLPAPAKVQDELFTSGLYMLSLNFEVLPEYVGDYIFILGDFVPPVLESHSVWQSLPPVIAGNVGFLNMMLYLQNGIIYAEAQFSGITQQLSDAFDMSE